MGTKTMKIKGMTCEHCVNNVTNAINKVAGASAKVSLKDKEAIISYDRELSNIELRKAVEDAGYEDNMKDIIECVKTGEVTYAVRDTSISAIKTNNLKQKHFFLYITDLKSAFLFSDGFDNFFYNTVLYESDMTSYPASSTAFLRSKV